MKMALHSKSPITLQAREATLRLPSLCDELRVRDILDSVVITTTGEFVAAYELSGIHSQYHDDDTRNRTNESLEALLRAIPERSMRMHLRFEIRQDAGSAVDSYIRASRTTNSVLLDIDRTRQEQWEAKEKR